MLAQAAVDEPFNADWGDTELAFYTKVANPHRVDLRRQKNPIVEHPFIVESSHTTSEPPASPHENKPRTSSRSRSRSNKSRSKSRSRSKSIGKCSFVGGSEHLAIERAKKTAALEKEGEKRQYLMDLRTMKQNGVKLTREYTMNDSHESIEFEWQRNMIDSNMNDATNMMTLVLQLGATGIEMGNALLNTPLRLNGWSERVVKDADKFRQPMRRIYKKHWRKGAGNPYLHIGFLLTQSMISFHREQQVSENKQPGVSFPRSTQHPPAPYNLGVPTDVESFATATRQHQQEQDNKTNKTNQPQQHVLPRRKMRRPGDVPSIEHQQKQQEVEQERSDNMVPPGLQDQERMQMMMMMQYQQEQQEQHQEKMMRQYYEQQEQLLSMQEAEERTERTATVQELTDDDDTEEENHGSSISVSESETHAEANAEATAEEANWMTPVPAGIRSTQENRPTGSVGSKNDDAISIKL